MCRTATTRAPLLANPDSYTPPVDARAPTAPGFDVTDDYGLQLTIKDGNPQQAIQPGWYYPVVINPDEGPGGNNYRDNIASCDPTVIERGRRPDDGTRQHDWPDPAGHRAI